MWAVCEDRVQTSQQRGESGRLSGWLFFLIFGLLAGGIVSAGYFFHQNFEQHFRAGVERQLSAIAELKVEELTQWRKARLGDGELLLQNPAFSALVRRFLGQPADADAQQQLHAWLGKYPAAHEYDRVLLLDAQGAERLAIPTKLEPLAAHLPPDIAVALRSGRVTFLDFHRDAPDRPIHLSILVPILDDAHAGRPLGALLLRIDPETYLYPLIKRWPTPSLTAETLLVRREGNDALFLNELRFRTNTALSVRRSLTQTNLPAVMAASGRQGLVEGVDYRGASVVADVRPVPDSPWFMVTRMDKAEVYGPLRERLWLVLVLIASLLFGAGAGVGLVWRRQSLLFYRKQAQTVALLLESEEKFLRVFEHSNAGMSITKPSGEIEVNQAFCDMLGYSPAELHQQRWQDLSHPADVEETQRVMEKLLAGGRQAARFTKRYLHKNGSVVWADVSSTLRRDAAGQPLYFMTIVLDTTARQKAETALREANEYLDNLFNYANAPIIVWDPQFKITRFNHAFENLTGRTAAEVMGQSLEILFPDTMVESSMAQIRTTLTGDRWETVEIAIQHRDGPVATLLWNSATLFAPDGKTPVATIAQGHNITERKRAMETLRESEAFTKTVLDNLPVGIAVNSVNPAVQFSYMNDNFPKIYRTTRARLSSPDGFWTAVYEEPAFREKLKQRVLEDCASGDAERMYWTDIPLTRAGEKTAFISASNTPLSDKQLMISMVWDVTERKQAEAALQQSARELQEKNAELERFLYTASHDLKSPVVTIRTFIGYLGQDLAANQVERVEKDMAFIRGAADKMARLLEDLLEISRIGRIVSPPVPVTLLALVEEARAAVAGRLTERGVRMQVTGPEVTFYGDRLRLAEIWQNLIENAVKFMGAQSAPTIEIGMQPRDAEQVFFVRDNGIGIDPRFQSKIFDLFEKLDAKAEGTGIGLAVVKRIVEVYGGRIWVESAGLDQGACFYFTLPEALHKPKEGKGK
jgi:PAS domain S-box-containing protein